MSFYKQIFINSLLFLTLVLFCKCYVITTPRKWSSGGQSQVCATVTRERTDTDFLSLSFIADSEVLFEQKQISVPTEEKKTICTRIAVPSVDKREATVKINGSLEGIEVDYSKSIALVGPKKSIKTYVQTDKYLYKPSQTVNIRILSLKGPFLKVFYGKYPEIWIENPNKSRLKQWLNVTSRGLVHLNFELSEEPTEGLYLVRVQTRKGEITDGQFKVEEYVLPRYEVTLTPPPYLLINSKSFLYQVCAKYTFGEPVKGQTTLTVSNGKYGRFRREVTLTKNFTGCAAFPFDEKSHPIITRSTYVLRAEAEVIEDGTGTLLKPDKVSTSVEREAIAFQDISMQKYAKPGLPFLGEVKASFPDGSPAASEPMKVCAKGVCKEVTSNNRGIIKFALPPHLLEKVKIVSLGYPKERKNGYIYVRESSFSKTIEEYKSPSGSSLIVGLTQRKLECLPGKEIEFDLPIWFSALEETTATVTLQILSRGQVLFADTRTYPLKAGSGLSFSDDLYLELPKEPASRGYVIGSFTFRVVLPKTASPEAKILVWYPRDDGEIVSDFRSVDVTECLLNDVTLEWASDRAYPGDETALSLLAEPSSLCSIGVVDKSVNLLQPDEDEVTLGGLLKVVETFAIGSNEKSQIDDNEYCSRIEETGKTEPGIIADDSPYHHRSRYSTIGKDTLHMFNDAGIYVMTNHKIEFRECKVSHFDYYDYFDLDFAPMPAAGYYDAPVEFSPIIVPISGVENPPPLPPPSPPAPQKPRVFFPETWLWKLSSLSDTGSYSENLTLPDTVTEWVGKAVCVHPFQGVGVSKASSITTFRDFFVDLTLPPTAKRGEVFPVKISVFNYLSEPLPVRVSILPSAEFDLLSDVSYESETGERLACVDGQDKVVHSILIRPMATGDVNITVDAFVDANSLSNCNQSNQVERRDTLIKPIHVDFEGFSKEKTLTDYLCVSETKESGVTWNIAVPSAIVEDSARGFVSAVGDLMGPTIENLGHLVRMPTGCGEQNMVGFAPNIFVMQYLEASLQGSEETRKNAKSYMESGYKRELNYRHEDGSFSAFGKSDSSGSTWLTAFVLKCFAQARPYIFIDQKDLDSSTKWLKGLQTPDGCFRNEGRVLHKEMKGGIANSDSSSVLSSFVLISLLEAGESPGDEYVSKAISCIKADSTSQPYALALKAYALTLARDASADQAISQLLTKVTYSGASLDWSQDAGSRMSDALKLEASGYAVLSLMEKGRIDQAVRFIRSMNTQRNGEGGFISTQDTIVALQAMASYEKGIPQTPTDLTLLLDIQGGFESSLSINESNKLLLQKVSIPSMPTVVKVDVFGQGCALVQAVLRYNVPKPDASEAFKLSVEATTEPDKGCKTKRIRVCTSYQLPDLNSNMAIIEVDVMTGYIPDKTDLKGIVGGSDLIKRYEVDGSKVLFYVDELSPEDVCVSFKVFREFEVEDAKNGTVSIYDYYSPQYAISKSYRLPPYDHCVELEDF